MQRFFPLFIALFALLLYVGTLKYTCLPVDDYPLIVNRMESLKSPNTLLSTFAVPVAHSPYYRPLLVLSWKIDAMIGGRLQLIGGMCHRASPSTPDRC
mgnify:CR=1 FL=1